MTSENNLLEDCFLFFSNKKWLIKSICLILCLSSLLVNLNAQTVVLEKSNPTPFPNMDETFNFVLDLSCSSSTGPCQDVVIRDTIPDFLEFLNFSSPLPVGILSATYDPVTREALIIHDVNMAAGSSLQLKIQVRFPNGTLNGSQAINYAQATSFNAGVSRDSAMATANTTFLQGDFPDRKTGDPRAVTGGYQFWGIEIGNIGFETIDDYSIVDTIPTGMRLDQIRTPEFTNVDHPGAIYYQSSGAPGIWSLWTPINLNDRRSYFVSGLSLPAGDSVTMVRLDLNSVPGNGSYNPYIYPDGFNSGWTLYAFEVGNRIVGDSFTNCAHYSGTSQGVSISDEACITTNIIAPINVVGGEASAVDENHGEQTVFSVDDSLRVTLDFFSPPPMGYDIVGGVLALILPPNVSYAPDSWFFLFGEDNADFQEPIVEVETLVDGRELVRFVWDSIHNNSFTIEHQPFWDGFRIVFSSYISPAAIVGDHEIELYYYATHTTHDNCNNIDTEAYLGGYSTFACRETDAISFIRPPGSAGLESTIQVKGTLDTDYSTYPDRGLTVPGGISDYMLTIKNPNAAEIDQLVFVTVLPHIGDTEVLDETTPRFSEWRPFLAEEVAITTTGLNVEYSTVSNPCRDDLAGSNPTPFPTGCNTANWSSSPPVDITEVTALRFDYGNRKLQQDDSLVVLISMRSPVDAPPDTSIAWNSFAFSARNFEDFSPLLPAEPIKVGIELRPGNVPILGDFVWEDTEPNGMQDPGEIGVDGVRVELYHDVDNNGVAEPSGPDTLELWTVTTGGGQYLFSDFDFGRYFVVFSDLPSGYVPTFQDVGVDTLDSDGLISSVMLFDNTTINYSHDLGLYNGVLPALYDISGSIYEDINYGGGDGRNYNFANIFAQTSGWALGDIGIDNARVELYDNTGAFVDFTLTDVDGLYTFSGILPGSYIVRVVSQSLSSNRVSNATGQTIIPVQTYRHDGSSAFVNEVGGADPTKVDAASNTTSANLSSLNTLSTVGQSISSVTVNNADLTNIDFGFNYDVIVNTNDSGQGSLRQFILNSNELDNTNLDQLDNPTAGVLFPKDIGVETSIFMIPGGGVHTITSLSSLPIIRDEYTHVTGYTQGGSSVGPISTRTLAIELKGNTAILDGINIGASHTQVSGLAVNDFRSGIRTSFSGQGLFIWGNYVGTTADGITGQGNSATGISVQDFDDSYIGTNADAVDDANEGNLASDNDFGIQIRSTSGILIAGNIIGLTKDGNAPLGNVFNGIFVRDADGVNKVGFDDTAVSTVADHFRNISSANGNDGVRVVGSSNQVVAGNYLGTDITGTLPLGNTNYGIQLEGTSSDNIFGTDSDGDDDTSERNVLSANGSGIRFLVSGSGTNNRIAGNYIGVTSGGNTDLGNTNSGIDLNGNFSQTIVGTNGDNINDLAERNILSGNGDDGIRFADSNDNIVAGNYIGVGADGSTPIPNDKRGVFITTTSADNTIGYDPSMANQDELVVGNMIKNNGDAGIGHPGTGTQNRYSRNQIANNGSLGIDLAYDSVTSNDDGDGDAGSNDLINFPVITSALLLNNNLVIQGFAPSGSSIEFYVADVGPSPNPLPPTYSDSFGEGSRYLFAETEGGPNDAQPTSGTYSNDGTGLISTRTQSRFSFSVDVSSLSLAAGFRLSAITIDANDNTSEFSGVFEILENCGTSTTNPHVMYYRTKK